MGNALQFIDLLRSEGLAVTTESAPMGGAGHDAAGDPLPDDFTLAGRKSLGLSIVETLVEDLGGTFEMTALGEGFGTRARLVVPMP